MYFYQEEPNGLICSYKVKPKVRVPASPKQHSNWFLVLQSPMTVKLPHSMQSIREARSDLLHTDLNNLRI